MLENPIFSHITLSGLLSVFCKVLVKYSPCISMKNLNYDGTK